MTEVFVQKIITRADEDKFLLDRIAANPLFRNPLTFDEIMTGIISGSLKLEMTNDDGVESLDEDCIDKILKTMPFLLNIVSKPNYDIESYEEKLPIETAKKMNYQAISKLSRDSNDWHARTIMSVKPKYISAEVNDETYDTYENRLFCTLVRLLSSVIGEVRHACEDELSEINGTLSYKEMEEEYNFSDSVKIYGRIVKKQYDMSDSIMKQFLEQRLSVLKGIEGKLSLIKQSELYKSVVNKGKVSNPVHKNNTIMFNQNYREAYLLWEYLQTTHLVKRKKIDEEIVDSESVRPCFMLYTFLCVLTSLSDMQFEEETGNKIMFNDKLMLTGSLQFVRKWDRSSFRCDIEGDDIVLWYIIPNKIEKKGKEKYVKNKWKESERDAQQLMKNRMRIIEIRIRPDYTNLEDMGDSDMDQKISELLDGLTDLKKKDEKKYGYSAVSINLSRSKSGDSLTDKTCRRLFSIGENYSDSEDRDNLERWGSYRAGMIIICPTRLKRSLWRIEKILNYHIVTNALKDGRMDVCPVCGDRGIQKLDDGFICNSSTGCKRKFCYTSHECSPKKTREITWIKYIDDHFIKEGKAFLNIDKDKNHTRMGRIELMMRECTTTFSDIVKEDGRYKLKTICPHCGRYLGQ